MRFRASSHRIAGIAAAFALASGGVRPCAAQAPVAGAIQSSIAALEARGDLALGRDTVIASPLLIAAYREAAFAPLWGDPAARAELIRLIEGMRRDGLAPEDYHLATLAAAPDSLPLERVAELDVLRTASLLAILHDLAVGRERPTLSGIGAGMRAAEPARSASDVRAMIEPGRLTQAVEAVRPGHFVYRGLAEGLERLWGIAAEGGWDSLPAGPPMMRDSADARVPALRRRLLREGYVLGQSGSAEAFDAGLDRAVRAFQHRHGLNQDGVVGEATRAALNVPVEARIDQIVVNLERARWISHTLPREFVAVNVAGAKVYLVRDDTLAFETRAIVGKEYTQTPMFAATMRSIDLNPTWTVPPGIVGEILDAIRRDPRYLERERIRVLDRQGNEVDRAGIDFRRYTARTFPYVFEGEPGPTNPLGRIKFLLPNEYAVYLHDTPARELFARETRTFSHGCIRVQDPLRLAELVLEDPELWSVAGLEAEIARGETRSITLRRPIPVLVFYWTASADPDGQVHFYRDLNGRDAEILTALRAR